MAPDELIRLWEAGESTPGQERELKAYLRQGDIPEEHKVYRMMFDGMSALAEEKAPEHRRVRLGFWLARTAVAAAILIGCTVGFRFFSEPYCYIDGHAVRSKTVAMNAVNNIGGLEDLDAYNQMIGSEYAMEALNSLHMLVETMNTETTE